MECDVTVSESKEEQQVFVSDMRGFRVCIFNTDGKLQPVINGDDRTHNDHAMRPIAIACASERLVVLDGHPGPKCVWDKTGKNPWTFASHLLQLHVFRDTGAFLFSCHLSSSDLQTYDATRVSNAAACASTTGVVFSLQQRKAELRVTHCHGNGRCGP